MTKEQAIALFESGWWKELTLRQRAEFQLIEDLLCMPFEVFHEAVEKTLGRPVYTHEFGLARKELISELLGDRQAPTLKEMMQLIPADKAILLLIAPEAAP
jgi:hypothetical protein